MGWSATYLAVDDALAALFDLGDDVGREQLVEPCEQLAAGWITQSAGIPSHTQDTTTVRH